MYIRTSITALLMLSISLVTVVAPVLAASYHTLKDAQNGCGDRNVVIDNACQREKLLKPNATCGIYICEGDTEFNESETLDLNFFGVRINARQGNLLQTLMFVGFNVFLGVVVLVLIVYGIRGAFIRARAESDDDLAKANKIMTNAIVGLAIIAASFVIAQLAASFLGLGSIVDIVKFEEFNLRD